MIEAFVCSIENRNRIEHEFLEKLLQFGSIAGKDCLLDLYRKAGSSGFIKNLFLIYKGDFFVILYHLMRNISSEISYRFRVDFAPISHIRGFIYVKGENNGCRCKNLPISAQE